MKLDIKIIALITIVAIMSVVLVLLTITDFIKNKGKSEYKKGEWLFTNFWVNCYPLFFKKDVLESAKKLGIHTDEYLSNCKVAGIKPNLKKYVMDYLGAIFLVFFGIILFFVFFLMDMDLYVTIAVTFFFLLIGAYIMEVEKKKATNLAKEKRDQIVDEMPRFLDLVEASLYIGLPIDTALMMSAENIPGVISEELIKAADDTANSEKSWQTSLFEIADKYNVEILTNFVLDVTTSYKKGVSIYESVARQNIQAKQIKLMDVEARAQKTKTIVMLPVAIFKLLPIMALFLFPVIEMLKGF